MNWIMERFTWGSGLMKDYDMEKEFKSGKMGRNMRGTGNRIWRMAGGGLFMLMAMFMKESGLTIKRMEKECIFTWTALNI